MLAVDVIAESHTLAEIAIKVQTYLKVGVAKAWMVDHPTRGIELWTVQGTTSLRDTKSRTGVRMYALWMRAHA
ncbi:MAG TPA: hypothetical protein VGN32_10145 [Ktedonobacterales bacterium]|nr:hypothetical protein [Ktedonobacterales bacterium]